MLHDHLGQWCASILCQFLKERFYSNLSEPVWLVHPQIMFMTVTVHDQFKIEPAGHTVKIIKSSEAADR